MSRVLGSAVAGLFTRSNDAAGSSSSPVLSRTRRRLRIVGGFFEGIWLRAPGAPQATFASEQTIDALAHAANMDPIACRFRACLDDASLSLERLSAQG